MTTQSSLFGGRIDAPILVEKDSIDPIMYRDLANNVLHHQDMQSQPLVNWMGTRTFDGVSGSKHSSTDYAMLLFRAGPIRLSRTASDGMPKLRVRMAGRRQVFGVGSASVDFSVVISAGEIPWYSDPSLPPIGGVTVASVSGITSGTDAWFTLSGSLPYSVTLEGTQQTISTFVDTSGNRSATTFDSCFISVYAYTNGDDEVFPILSALHVSEVF